IIISKALDTFSSCRADASVHAQFHSCVSARPSSADTCRWMWRSDLLPTTTMGTQSAPWSHVSSGQEWHLGEKETYKMVENLVSNDFNHFERLLRGHRVDQHVAVDTNRVAR